MSFLKINRLIESSSELHPEMFVEFKKNLEEKRKSRIIIRANEVEWRQSRQASRSARLIDPRQGFANSICNMGLGEISVGSHTGKHKHGEAYVYILKGKGHSVIDEKTYDWGEGDAIYVPPNVFHQHFNDGKEPARYLRVVPGPLCVNLVPLLAAMNASFEGNFQQEEFSPEYKGPKPKRFFDEEAVDVAD